MFRNGETVTVNVSAGDDQANRGSHAWSFSTRPETVPPDVVLDVPLAPSLMHTNHPITLRFPGDIDKGSVSVSITGSVSGPVTGSWAWSDSSYAFTPDGYAPGETLSLTVNAMDIHMNAMPEHQFELSVKSDENPPMILSRSPADGAENVASDANVTVVFTEDIDPDSTTVSLHGEGGRIITFNSSWEDSVLTIPNSGMFRNGETVTVSVTAGDDQANRGSHAWSFRTRPETVPPDVSVDVPLAPSLMHTNHPITLRFPGDIDKGSVSVSITGSVSGPVGGSWAWSDSSYVFTPDGYAPGETMVLTVDASDVNGNAMPRHEFDLAVKGDETAPEILSFSPPDGAVNVSPDENVTVSFSDDVLPDSTRVTVTGREGRTISLAASWDASTLTFSNGGEFDLSETITVDVDAGDLFANRTQRVWTFTVRTEANTPALRLDVPSDPNLMRTDDPITLIFPGDIDRDTVEAALEGDLSDDVAGTWAWTDSLYIFTPVGYTPGERLSLVVGGSDVNGNVIPETEFVLWVKGDEEPPRILSTNPPPGADNIDPAADVTIVFSGDVEPDSTAVTITGDADRPISMQHSWRDSVLTLVNTNSFRSGELVSFTLNAGDRYANRITGQWHYDIRRETVPPVLDLAVPESDGIIPRNASFMFGFPADIDTASVDVSLTGSVSGSMPGDWSWADSTFTFTPSGLYEPGETVTLAVAAKDVNGNTMAERSETYTVGEHSPWIVYSSITRVDGDKPVFRIEFESFDDDGSYTVSRAWQYSTDGRNWHDIAQSQIAGNEYHGVGSHAITWTAPDSLDGVYAENFRFRMELYDGLFSSGRQPSPPFIFDYNSPPAVAVTGVAPDYESGELAIAFSITDAESDSVDLAFSFSRDNGVTWSDVEKDDAIQGLSEDLYTGSFRWSYIDSLEAGVDYFGFRVRLTPHDFKDGEPGISEPVNIDLNEPPTVLLDDIFTTQSGDVTIEYHVADAESDTVSFSCWYSLDRGETWNATSSVTGRLDRTEAEGNLVWHSKRDIPAIQTFSAAFRVVPYDHDEGTGDATRQFQLFNNGPPSIVFSLPEEAGNTIAVPFTISDPENDTVSLTVEWSADGEDWSEASVIGTLSGIEETAYEDTLIWQSGLDAPGVVIDEAHLRITPADSSNPPGSSALIPGVRTLKLDNRPPRLLSATGFAGMDSVYFSFDEDVSGDAVSDPSSYGLSHGLAPASAGVLPGGEMYFIVVQDGQELPLDTVTLTASGIADKYGATGETSLSFMTQDDNDNPEVTLSALPDTVEVNVPVEYVIRDTEGDPVTLTVRYSIDGGETWSEAMVEGEIAGIAPDAYTGSFVWRADIDLPGAGLDGVLLEVVAADTQAGTAFISDPFYVDTNIPPAVSLSTADPDSIYSGAVTVGYQLSDSEGDTLRVEASYSLDGGATYLPATVEGIAGEGFAPEAYAGVLTWDTDTDVENSFAEAWFKLIPFDDGPGVPDSLLVKIDNYGVCQVAVSAPDGEQTGDITISYGISDPNGLPVTLTVTFSTDGGATWSDAVVEGNLADIGPSGYTGSFVWKAAGQLAGFEGSVMIRVLPDNGMQGLSAVSTVAVDYNAPPTVEIGELPEELAGEVSIPYTATDAEGDTVDVTFEYSIDSGGTWYAGEIEDDLSGIVADGSTRSITWLTGSDLPGRETTRLRLRLAVSDSDAGVGDETGDLHLDNNQPPAIALTPADADSVFDGTVEIGYQITDAENNMTDLLVEYSTDDGDNYATATVTGKTSGIFSSGYQGAFTWDITADLPAYFGEALLRVTPADNDPGESVTVTIRINTIGTAQVSLALPDGEQTGPVTVSYLLADENGNTIDLVVHYARSSFGPWYSATVEGTIEGIEPGGYSGSFTWRADADLDGLDGVGWLRVTPDNGAVGLAAVDSVSVDYNAPPLVELDFIDKEKIYSGMMGVSILVSDEESDAYDIVAEYSVDGGATFTAATLAGDTDIRPGSTQRVFWDTFADLGFVHEKETLLRLTPWDTDAGTAYVTGSFRVTNLPGDFTFDGNIDGSDLPVFVDAWKKQDLSMELGPATGEPPALTLQSDGVIDFEDLAVFVMMWNWQSGMSGRYVARELPDAAENGLRGDGAAACPFSVGQGDDGVLAIESGPVLDYARFVLRAENPAAGMAFEGGGWWSMGPGVFLDRENGDGALEAAGARFDAPAATGHRMDMGRILFTGDPGSRVSISWEARIAGETTIRSGTLDIDTSRLTFGPGAFALRQNTPNPFNPSTTIRYDLPHRTHVFLAVYTVHGQLVDVLLDGAVGPGSHAVVWDGSGMAAGVYICTMRTNGFTENRKMLLVK